jgi:hypothetical protein
LCGNWRGITPITVTKKILVKIITKRSAREVSGHFGEEQVNLEQEEEQKRYIHRETLWEI